MKSYGYFVLQMNPKAPYSTVPTVPANYSYVGMEERMATLNRKTLTPLLHTHEGAPAKRTDTEQMLRRSVMACLLWEGTFYEDGAEIAGRIQSLASSLPLDTVASIAIEAREEMNLRHVPLLLVREMARRGGSSIVGDTLARVIQRPDELAEFLAIYWKSGKEPLSAQVKRGLALAFRKFDAYQLAKYNRDKDIKLRDVMFLVHPKPENAEQAANWKALAEGTLPTPDTWETVLSGGAEPRAAWTRLIEENKLGGLAILRNLRNMQEAGVPDELIRTAISQGKYFRVLPFRFISAAKYAPRFEGDLETAMFKSLEGMPKLSGKTVLVIDHSGSMQGRLSSKSDLTRLEAASGVAMLLREVCEACEVVVFSSSLSRRYYAYEQNAPLSAAAVVVPARRGFALTDAVMSAIHWGGTDTEAGKKLADELGYDRVIIITDEQSHTTLSNPRGVGYVVNVAAYRNGIGYGSWIHIDGWSDAVVRYITELERLSQELA